MHPELYLIPAYVACYDNDNDAFVPEVWANESLMQLEENMVMANLVHRDFSDEVANFGDTVNTRRPNDFGIDRKTDSDSLNYEDAVASNVAVKLDQWFTKAFVIKDGEGSKSFQDLVDVYLTPAVRSLSRGVDRALYGRIWDFLVNRSGRLGELTKDNAQDYVLNLREELNQALAPMEGRRLLLSPTSETAMLKVPDFIRADQRGDGGAALETARLGRIYGIDTFMSQHVPSPAGLADTVTGAVNSDPQSAGYDSDIDVSITGHTVEDGEFVDIAGNDQPTYAVDHTDDGSDTSSVTLHEALKFDIAGSAAITVYTAGAVNHPTAGTYPVGWSKPVAYDGMTNDLKVGQLVAFGTGADRRTYTVIYATSTEVLLDRPLEVAVGDNDLLFPGPIGSYNFAFHRNALALVSRPLAMPRASNTAQSAVVSANGLGLRVTMQYDIDVTGTKVNVDLLCGTKTLDSRMGGIMLG